MECFHLITKHLHICIQSSATFSNLSVVNQEHGYCINQNLCSRLSRQLGPTKWEMEMEEGDQKVLVPSSFLELVQRLKLLFHYGYPGGKKKSNEERVVIQ